MRMGQMLRMAFLPAAVAACVGAFGAEEALPGNAETMGMSGKMIGDQISLRCERFELKFAADGKHTVLIKAEKQVQVQHTARVASAAQAVEGTKVNLAVVEKE